MGDKTPHRQQPQLTDDYAENPQRVSPYTSVGTMGYAPYPAQAIDQAQYQSTITPFNMANIAGTLPDYQLRNYEQQAMLRQSNTNMVYQMPQAAQYAGQSAHTFNPMMQQQYGIPSQQPHQPGRGANMQYSQFPNHPQFSQSSTSQAQYHPQIQQQFYQQPASGNYVQGYPVRGGTGYPMGQIQPESGLAPNAAYTSQQRDLSRNSSTGSLQVTVPRGPPRKPKQSGHALWVGNLPPGTHVIDLKDHFSRDATDDIESVFLISKSNCAFVNYKTESSCAAAMSRFHDSRFQGVRLVCRLRRGSTPSPAKPTESTDSTENDPKKKVDESEHIDDGEKVEDAQEAQPIEEKVQEKYFIVKSLTVEDLELSVLNGTWATQAHNEVSLNKAYQSAENVFLVFSANKSGEYFGYARMTSDIDEEQVPVPQQPPRPEVYRPLPSEQPTTILTPATATAPKGRIIDDSARGTIFWEADLEEIDGQKAEDPGNISTEGEDISPSNPQAFGKPFRIEWISTERLPFYRTRGLRNPWNSNREVKIARDGTELEPSVGRRLVSMFHRAQVPSLSPNSTRNIQQLQQGYPRPY